MGGPQAGFDSQTRRTTSNRAPAPHQGRNKHRQTAGKNARIDFCVGHLVLFAVSLFATHHNSSVCLEEMPLTTVIGINGFGRIGRLVCRAACANKAIKVVAINEIGSAESNGLHFILANVPA